MTTPPDAFPDPEPAPRNLHPSRLRNRLEGDDLAVNTDLLAPGDSMIISDYCQLYDSTHHDSPTGTHQVLFAIMSPKQGDEIFGLVKIMDRRPERKPSVLALVDLSNEYVNWDDPGNPVVGVLRRGGAVQAGGSLRVDYDEEGSVVLTDLGSTEGTQLFTRKLAPEKVIMPIKPIVGSIALGRLRRALTSKDIRYCPTDDPITEDYTEEWAIYPRDARAILDNQNAESEN